MSNDIPYISIDTLYLHCVQQFTGSHTLPNHEKYGGLRRTHSTQTVNKYLHDESVSI